MSLLFIAYRRLTIPFPNSYNGLEMPAQEAGFAESPEGLVMGEKSLAWATDRPFEDPFADLLEPRFDLVEYAKRVKAGQEFYETRAKELEKIAKSLRGFIRPVVEPAPSFVGWAISKCAKQLILENAATMTSRELLDEMLKRGWTTESLRPITVVHACLSESPYIKRVGKRWDISDKGLDTEL